MNNKEEIIDYNYQQYNFKNLFKPNLKDDINIYFKDCNKKKIINKINIIQKSKNYNNLYKKFINKFIKNNLKIEKKFILKMRGLSYIQKNPTINKQS